MKAIATLLLYALLALPFGSMAQKFDDHITTPTAYDQPFAALHYYNYKLLAADDTAAIQQILARELNLGEDVVLRVAHVATSLTATHITFDQYFRGIKVFGAGAKVAVSRNNVLFRCIENVLPTYPTLQHLGGTFNANAKLAAYKNLEIQKVEPVFLWNGDVLQPGWSATFLHDETGCNQAAWWANGNLYFDWDMNRYFAGPDSLVEVKVFMPDPITPIGKAYGGIYIDMNDANESVLDPLRVSKEVETLFDTGYFHLKSDFVEIKEHSGPVYEVVKSNSAILDYTRSHHGFEQTNAYFHIMNFQSYLQSLGYTLVNYPIQVDAQGFNGADNSAFTPGTNPPRLTFGEGGVDDAEDADVVVHEYGHAISHSAAPTTNQGTERQSLDEALGDYFAVSYTRNEFSFNNNWVFNWDGHNPFFSGRTVDNPTNLNYKTTTFTSIYKNTTLWNDAMFDIWDQLGKTYTDKLQIEALYGYYRNMTFTDAALLVLDADTALTGGGQNSIIIWQAFDARGILDWTSISENGKNTPKPYTLLNTRTGRSIDVVLVWKNEAAAVAEVFDMQGRGVAKIDLEAGENSILNSDLAAGMYTLLITSNGQQYAEKLVISQ
jgi:hypothetical protein